jgi:sigma-E factor negative regulatory protein RseA
MDTNKKNREIVSALADDEVLPADLELAMAALLTPEGGQAWQRYHRIGDVLRAHAAPDLSPGFADRLAARLAAEPQPGKRTAGAPSASGAPVTVEPD